MKEGDALSILTKNITQDNIAKYAEASGDFNPIHLDESFAQTTPFNGTIAHGMLLLGFLSELMSNTFGHDWAESGKLRVRFRGAAHPGDTITITGKVSVIQEKDGTKTTQCALECRNQIGTILITGEGNTKSTTS